MNRINVYEYLTAEQQYDNPDDPARRLVGWFDLDSATTYREDTFWDGHKEKSKATGSQYDHETLYRTKGGRWVLHRWSQWQGRGETYRFIADDEARGWLLEQSEDDAVRLYFGEIEPERGPGRPEIGPAFSVRLGEGLTSRLDAAAQAGGMTRAAMLRQIVEAAV